MGGRVKAREGGKDGWMDGGRMGRKSRDSAFAGK